MRVRAFYLALDRCCGVWLWLGKPVAILATTVTHLARFTRKCANQRRRKRL